MNRRSLLAAYLRQQKELTMPDLVFPQGGAAERFLKSIAPAPEKKTAASVPAAARSKSLRAITPSPSKAPYARLSKLAPLSSRMEETVPPYRAAAALSLPASGPLTFEQKRDIFKELYTARCGNCALAKTRKTFVFGAGNVDAPLMLIGEAPGADEDAQGLPFVGAAGQLLTELLMAVALDRKKDVFITNVLKCRPPGNRTPGDSEVVACLPLLKRQIQVIAPRLLLLLGRVAAHALLGSADSIAKLRGTTHTYEGIPAIVTYHPAAILRNPEYRGPTESDLQKAVHYLKENTPNATA
jgi:uracil-DNA glycosylase